MVLTLHPETLPTYKALALVYLRQERPEEIERLYDDALSSLPDDAMQARERLTRELEEFRERKE
jgi:tetratricopeptide (TPR) repeat protein